MSGPDERRADGGEHPLDVDARFADIVAHFHDGEPEPPHLVDAGSDTDPAGDPAGDTGADGSPAATSSTGSTAYAAPTPPTRREGPEDLVGRAVEDLSHERADDRADNRAHERDRRVERAEDSAATDWAARYERAAREELAAHQERLARAAREARIQAEIDRAVDGPDHHFVPQEPPPLPRPDLPGRLAWGAVLLGPLALVLCALLWQTVPPWVVGAVVTAIVAGFGYLVWRLPRTRDRDDPTDGAIV